MKIYFTSIFFAICICFFIACTSTAKVSNFLGSEIFEIISKPDIIESYQVDPKKKAEGEKLYVFPIIRQGQNLTADQMSNLKSVLLNDGTYDFKLAKKGFIFPEFAFKIIKADKEVLLFVCYYRKELMFVYDKKELKEDFDSAEPDMRKLTDQLFK